MTGYQERKLEEVKMGGTVRYRYVAYEDDEDSKLRVWDVVDHKRISEDSPNYLETLDWKEMSKHLVELNTVIFWVGS